MANGVKRAVIRALMLLPYAVAMLLSFAISMLSAWYVPTLISAVFGAAVVLTTGRAPWFVPLTTLTLTVVAPMAYLASAMAWRIETWQDLVRENWRMFAEEPGLTIEVFGPTAAAWLAAHAAQRWRARRESARAQGSPSR